LDLAHHFTTIVVSEAAGVEKPATEMFLQTLNAVNLAAQARLPIEPEEVLHVGDDLNRYVQFEFDLGSSTVSIS
jgi:FMN phosphatase YigB (HAD superfamily)